MSLLQQSLHNFTLARSASSQNRSFGDAHSQKENVPAVTGSVGGAAVYSKHSDTTPTSKPTRSVDPVTTSPWASPALASTSDNARPKQRTPVLFSARQHGSLLDSPAVSSNSAAVQSIEENLKVVIRARPVSDNEQAGSVKLSGNSITSLSNGQEEVDLTFDHVAGPETSQEHFFKVVGKPMVETMLSGYNSCIFAYGQTGSGKTHTMLGQLPDAADSSLPEQAGLMPRMFAHLFDRITEANGKKRAGRERVFLCKCNFLEIYKEVITDLLNPAATRLHIREDAKSTTYVEGLSETIVSTAQEVLSLLQQGAQNRHVASTKANRDSSRSHCVFTCTLESRTTQNSITSIRTSCLRLVDLAGSERQKIADSDGERVKEAGSINRSLASLGLVIKKLVEGGEAPAGVPGGLHIPYRDSRLTFLLQDSLGGNAKTVMIANISLAASCLKETQSTLGFAQRAKLIRNQAVVNEDMTADAVALQRENERLRLQLEMYKELQKATTPPSFRPRRISIGNRSPLRQQTDSQSAGQLHTNKGRPDTQEADFAALHDDAAADDVTAAWANQLAAVLELNQDLEEKIVSLRQHNVDLRRDCRGLEAQCEQTQADMLALVQADIEAQQRAHHAEAQAQSLIATHHEQQARIAQLETEVLHAQPTMSTNLATDLTGRHEAASQDLVAQVATLQLQLANADSFTADLKKKLAQTEADKQGLAEAAEQLQQTLQQSSDQHERSRRDQQATTTDRQNLCLKIEQQRSELSEAKDTIKQLQDAAADLADKLQMARSNAGRQVGHNTAMRELSSDYEASLADLKSQKVTVSSQQELIAQLTKSLAAKEADAAADVDSIAGLTHDLGVKEAAMAAQQDSIAQLDADVSERDAAVTKLTASVSQLTAELAAATAQQAQHDQDATQQQAQFVGQVLQELQVLEAALLQKGQECDVLTQQLAQLAAEYKPEPHLAEQTAESAQQQPQHELAAQLQTQHELCLELKAELRAQHAKREELSERVLALEAHVAYKQHQLAAALKTADTTAAANAALQQELQSMQQSSAEKPVCMAVSTVSSNLHGDSAKQPFLTSDNQQSCTVDQSVTDEADVIPDLANSHLFSSAVQEPLASEQPRAAEASAADTCHLHTAAGHDKLQTAAVNTDLPTPAADGACKPDTAASASPLEPQSAAVAPALDQASTAAAASAEQPTTAELQQQLDAALAAQQEMEADFEGSMVAADALQQQLEQDRDSLMEEVLTAKAQAAQQQRTLQTLQAASEAAAREKALLVTQLAVTEQQLTECAQDMQRKQQEVQRLQAAEEERSVHLHKAQLRGSSNEHGLRGMQQRLQEVMEDKRVLEQAMEKRLQALQQAESTAAYYKAQCGELQQQLQDRLSHLQKLQQQLIESQESSEQLQQLQQQLTVSQQTSQQLQRQLADSQSAAEESSKRAAESQQLIDTLQQQLTQARLEAESKEVKLESRVQELDQAQSHSLQSMHQLRGMETERGLLRQQLSTAHATSEQLQQQLTESQQATEHAIASKQQLHVDLQHAEAGSHAMQRSIEALHIQIKQQEIAGQEQLAQQHSTQAQLHSSSLAQQLKAQEQLHSEQMLQQLAAQKDSHATELAQHLALQSELYQQQVADARLELEAQKRRSDLLQTDLQHAQTACKAAQLSAEATQAELAQHHALQSQLSQQQLTDSELRLKTQQAQSVQVLAELQHAQEVCRTAQLHAHSSEAEVVRLSQEVQLLQSSLQDRDELILELDSQIKALDTQTRASFAEHEGKLSQQREALARQHQKGLTTLQSGIDSLKAKLASDAQQHAAAVAELQDCNSALQRQKEQACSKVTTLQAQLQSAEAKAEAADRSAAALQQQALTWRARMKKREAEIASLTAKVESGPDLQQELQHAQAQASNARDEAQTATEALHAANQDAARIADALRRKDVELQHMRALASKARADGKALLARADSDAALFSEEMGKAEQKVQEAVQKAESSTATAVSHLQAQLSSLSKQRDAALADNHRLQGLLAVQRQRQSADTLQQHYEMLMADKQAAVQAVQSQLDRAKVEHAAVLSQLRTMHSATLEEVRHLRQQRRASPASSTSTRRRS